jgi:hypothetical protein
MHYIGSHEDINWLFVLACLSIMQWIIILILVYSKYHILGKSFTENAFTIKGKYDIKDYDKKNRISFTHDYFYIYWNIYPIIFYAFFYYLDTSWSTYLNQITMIGGEEARQVYNSWFKTFNYFGLTIDYKWIDIAVLLASIAIAYGSTFYTQIDKQKQFIDKTDKLYWWDIRISRKIFWTRFIFLFFNIILVAFIAYLGLKVVLFIGNILAIKTLIINPLHPDTYGGLKVLMEISSIILAIYLLRGMMGIVGLIDHKNIKNSLQFIGDVYNTAYLFFGIGFIVFFIYKVDTILGKVDTSKLLTNDIYKTFSIPKDTNISNIIQQSSDLSNYYSNLLQFNKFPIDLALFTSSIFTFILPLVIWFLVRFFEHRVEKYEKYTER